MSAEVKPLHGTISSTSVLRALLGPMINLIEQDDVNEVKVIEPGWALTFKRGAHVRHEIPELSFNHLKTLAECIANHSSQRISEERPILSATLPGGQRVQVVIPPAVPTGKISITIRVPDPEIRTLDSYVEDGAFAEFVWAHPPDALQTLGQLSRPDQELVQLLLDRNLGEFFHKLVRAKKTLAVIGDTGSGKTSLMKCLCQLIPSSEYLITIEDVREIMLPNHWASHLLYSKGGQGTAKVTPADLIASCMRMSPSRVLPAELRGSEAWDLLKLLTSGHSGTITTWHASSCSIAPERFVLMAKEHQDASTFVRSEIRYLVDLTFDAYVHVKAEATYEQDQAVGVRRYVSEVAFNPWAKNAAMYGTNRVRRSTDRVDGGSAA